MNDVKASISPYVGFGKVANLFLKETFNLFWIHHVCSYVYVLCRRKPVAYRVSAKWVSLFVGKPYVPWTIATFPRRYYRSHYQLRRTSLPCSSPSRTLAFRTRSLTSINSIFFVYERYVFMFIVDLKRTLHEKSFIFCQNVHIDAN